MSTEALKGFPKTIQTALRDGKFEYAARLFIDDKYAEDVKNSSWDLIPVVTEHLTEENRCKNPELFKGCKNLLGLISDNSNSEEALLQFISEIENAKENATFIALLEPLYKVICRISNRKVNSLAWSFNAVQTYLTCMCEQPDYDNLEGKERLLVDNGKIVSNITRLYTEILIFYTKLINNLQSNSDKEIKNVFRKFLIQLLGTPFCHITMEMFGEVETTSRVIAKDIVGKIFKTMTDPFELTEMRHEKEHDEFSKPDNLSLANFFYLLFYEEMCLELVPKVYSSIYIFDSLIYLINTLLKMSSIILIEKALKLSYVIRNVEGHNISYFYLDCDDHSEFCKTLSNIIIYNETESIRKMALQTLTSYLKSFEIRGVYLIILNLTKTLTHSGLKGYLITIYKDMLSKEFQHREKDMSLYFRGYKLFILLRTFCHLTEKEETNLMDNSDQIISSLNLLRFFALRDKNNTTKFWDFAPVLSQIFLEPLQRGLELSRAHYELEIKNITSEKQPKLDSEVSISVQGLELPKLQKEEKLKVLYSSLTAFDVMQSLLSRVIELLENKEI